MHSRMNEKAGHLLFWAALCFFWLGSEAFAKDDILVMSASKELLYCRDNCTKKNNWKPLPKNWLLSAGDRVRLPGPKSTLVYRFRVGDTSSIRVTGPKTLQLRKSKGKGPSLSKRLARLWQSVLQKMRTRTKMKVGALRAISQITKRRYFVDLVFPRNESLLKAPKALRWRPRRGFKHYRVRLSLLNPDWSRKELLKQEVSCPFTKSGETQNDCQLPLGKLQLAPHKRYIWQVKLSPKAGAPERSYYPTYGVYFQLLDDKQTKLLASHKESFRKLPKPERPLAYTLHLLKLQCFSKALQSIKLAKMRDWRAQKLRSQAYCAMCRPWILPPKEAKACGCDDDPNRPPDQ